MEARIRQLETGLDLFSGVEWIIRVGDIARLKTVVYDLPDGWTYDGSTAALDRAIGVVISDDSSGVEARTAFDTACRTLSDWLEMLIAAPGEAPNQGTPKQGTGNGTA